jgi:hypothetical protein
MLPSLTSYIYIKSHRTLIILRNPWLCCQQRYGMHERDLRQVCNGPCHRGHSTDQQKMDEYLLTINVYR